MKIWNHYKRITFLAVAGVLSLCFVFLAAAEEKNTLFYDYSAKKMSFDRKNGVTVFEGDVKINIRDRNDFLNADQVTIYRDVETGEMLKMVAVGNVDMDQEGMKATSQQAIFYETEDRIELEGSEETPAIVDDGDNRMEAPAITFYRLDNRLEANGNVKGHVIVPAKEGEEKAETEAEKTDEK